MVGTARRRLRELRAVLRVTLAVVATLLLGARPHHGPDPVAPVTRARSLVVLVHGFGAGPDCFDDLARALGGPGVAVVRHRYCWTAGVEELAARLADDVADLARRTGARSVTVVGHSLGGVVVAASLADRRLAGTATRVVTLGAPLGGTGWARLFPVGALRDLRPGAPVLRSLSRPDVPWTTIASRADAVVAVHRATRDGAEAVVVDRVGHCGLLRDAGVVARVAALCARPARPARRRTRRTTTATTTPPSLTPAA
ncbi:lipase [Actinomycetospora sp. NBRC 106375]|uniref:esterase/lipase family protein n=1 Tax=Actinomycetospora sp. NBRC 106375 TaxID=3032207 RepID=UPI0024A16145|nr:alpha/beta fold hydrolase [Actinomycetospora sp. NBRC 106375]GLZ49912.1 lipase [Actinomycetospora sp. NBRC 106375]